MTPDRLGRFELVATWRLKQQELIRQGECTLHLERFLQVVDGLPGDEVGEIGNLWRRRRMCQRPTYILKLLLAGWLICFLANGFAGPILTGLLVAGLALSGAQSLHQHWTEEEAFDRELYARASYVINRPIWAR